MAADDIVVTHNEREQRFEATVDGQLCRLDYERDGDVLRAYHTEVPVTLEGRGIASTLVRRAFEHARAAGLRIAPVCTYVRAWVKRHPEVADVLAS